MVDKTKSWRYADMLLKPEEKVMQRLVNSSGMGVHHVKMNVLAGFIRAFQETAGNPKFRHSL